MPTVARKHSKRTPQARTAEDRVQLAKGLIADLTADGWKITPPAPSRPGRTDAERAADVAAVASAVAAYDARGSERVADAEKQLAEEEERIVRVIGLLSVALISECEEDALKEALDALVEIRDALHFCVRSPLERAGVFAMSEAMAVAS